MSSNGFSIVALLAAVVAGAAAARVEAAEALAGDWQRSHAARVRLVAAGGAVPGQPLTGAVEIELDDGWKTYWRFPGDAGGVPPSFDWSGSTNARAEVLYPAPKRFSDRSGDTVGYKGALVLPLALTVTEPGKPVALRLKVEYGICKEICVPAEANLSLDVPAGFAAPVPAEVVAALARVPGPPAAGTPSLASQTLTLTGDKPQIAFEAVYPGSGGHADAFVEASDGAFVPLPRKAGPPHEGRQAFVVELAPTEAAELKGKTLTITLVSDDGQSETRIPVP